MLSVCVLSSSITIIWWDSVVHQGDGRRAGRFVEHARGITRLSFPLFPKSLSQEVCLAQSCSLQGGRGASKQRAEALTPACAIPMGPPLLSPVGGEREALPSTHGRFLSHVEKSGEVEHNPENNVHHPAQRCLCPSVCCHCG